MNELPEIKSPEQIKTRCIKPGGIVWTLQVQIVGDLGLHARTYYHAELYHGGRMFHVTAAMDSPAEVRQYIKRLYPEANEVESNN
jgi:hypothetical protein